MGKILDDFLRFTGLADINGPTLMEEVRYEHFIEYFKSRGVDYDIDAEKLVAADRAYISSELN